ncbi:porin [Terrihabitans sp. B22-R8]|uniref:porin n=1 Tax=Terrihabitans sp. B22-R8 TaxID=3425128 RepID=UPI00403CFE57
MKTVKTLLLGTAAGLAAFTGAQAADLPLAEPVEYVKVCSTYGEGFFYIPGTDTCLQISGYVRFDMLGRVNGDDDDDDFAGGPGADSFATNARGTIAADARSETEWGTLRSYIEFEGNSSSGAYPNGDNELHIEAAFVQFAGITAGKASSFFDFVNAATISDFFSAEQVNTLAYTATFGSGFAATIGIEDKYFRAVPFDTDLDQTYPNVIAAVRVDQAWGSAQISGAIQDNEGDVLDGFVDDEIGWAVQAGVKINLPTANSGSYVWAQGAYSEGAISYAGAEDVFGNGFDFDFTGVFDTSSAGEATEMWQVGGGITFQATAKVALTGAVTYSSVDQGVDGGFDYLHAEANVFYTPVKNLDLGLAVIYGSVLESDGPGDVILVEEQDDLMFAGRIQRSF